MPSSSQPHSISGRVSTNNLNTASTSQKRSATARMHAVSPRKRARPSDTEELTTAMDPTPAGTWLVKANVGESPPYTDHSGWVTDPFRNMIYMFGGIHPGDECLTPTSYFYSCDAKTMKWQNLTDELRFRDPSDPFGSTELRREKQQLPRLSQPGLTFFRTHGVSFIFIFGGYSVDKGEAVSNLIAVDLNHLEWWFMKIEGGNIAARINPVVVAIEQRIYIFGGYEKYSKTDARPLRSYSIAYYQAAAHRWVWEAQDVPYSGFIPPDQVFGAGIAVYNGKKIMLTPGKLLCHDYPLDFTQQKIYYFHTEHRQFQMAPHLGDYPRGVLWYTVHNFRPVSRKGPPKRGPGPSSQAGANPPTTSTSLPSPSVILCAWIPRPNSRYAVPELWRLSLSHNDEIRCLNKSQQIWDLNHDFQGCVAIDDRIILLGNNNPKGGECWNIHLGVVLTPEDREDKIDNQARIEN